MITLHAILEWTVSQSNNEGTGPGFRLPAKLVTNCSQFDLCESQPKDSPATVRGNRVFPK